MIQLLYPLREGDHLEQDRDQVALSLSIEQVDAENYLQFQLESERSSAKRSSAKRSWVCTERAELIFI